jgi:hypothetical protein
MKETYITQEDLRAVLWTSVKRMGSQKKVAKELCISEQWLSDILGGEDISEKVANRMGYTVSKMYAPIEKD